VAATGNTTLDGLAAATEPELDQFMEAYHEMLVKPREELTSEREIGSNLFLNNFGG
jgi:hypothetical protein